MGQGSEHITQILALVSDNLQVVSYKWLSRKFSISSNEAKSLLQSFVEQHGDSVEVVYAVSGWSKMQSQCYSVQLVPMSKLQEAKDLLEGHVSSHVYSVQPCIPKDPAGLWSAEFVQSEELFNEPPELSNCLRDNRFSAISFLSVVRKVEQKKCPTAPSVAPEVSAPIAKPPIVQAEVAPAPSATSGIQSSSHLNAQAVMGKDTGTVPRASAATTGTTTKGTITAPNKKKTTGANLQGGSLANLWGRASTKPKPLPEVQARLAVQDGSTSATGDAEALIRAHDASFDASSDDDATDFARLRRGQVRNSSGRKRRVIFEDDMSDVEKDLDSESIVHLPSPEILKERQDFEAALDKDKVDKKSEGPSKRVHNEGRLKSTPVVKNARTSPPDATPNVKHTLSGASLKEVKDLADTEGPDSGRRELDDDIKAGDLTTSIGPELVRVESPAANSGPKKRKVLKTRFDDRGREVTDVVWENEDTTVNHKEEILPRDANAHVKTEESKALSNKSLASMNIRASNAAPIPQSRANIKSSGKAATKDTQQGKILSFFKKTT